MGKDPTERRTCAVNRVEIQYFKAEISATGENYSCNGLYLIVVLCVFLVAWRWRFAKAETCSRYKTDMNLVVVASCYFLSLGYTLYTSLNNFYKRRFLNFLFSFILSLSIIFTPTYLLRLSLFLIILFQRTFEFLLRIVFLPEPQWAAYCYVRMTLLKKREPQISVRNYVRWASSE